LSTFVEPHFFIVGCSHPSFGEMDCFATTRPSTSSVWKVFAARFLGSAAVTKFVGIDPLLAKIRAKETERICFQVRSQNVGGLKIKTSKRWKSPYESKLQ